jgi:hypothetical protein
MSFERNWSDFICVSLAHESSRMIEAHKNSYINKKKIALIEKVLSLIIDTV